MLESMQIAALRQADDIAFFHRNGKSFIRAIKRAKQTEREPYAQEMTREIGCDTRWTDYSRETAMCYPMPEFDGFEMCGNYADSHLPTIWALLRKGDELTLHWQRDARRSPIVEATALHGDQLELIVTRGAKKMVFIIDCRISLDNSARMITNVRRKQIELA